MQPLKSFLTEEQIEKLASRSNFRYGKSIAEDGEFTVLKTNTFNLIVKVKQGSHESRTVTLESTHKGFRWKCTCSSKKNFFCEHAAAVGLFSLSH